MYASDVKGGKQEKTNWVMHQYHVGTEEDEKDGEFVVSKLFYQQLPKPRENNSQGITAADALEPVCAAVDLADCPPLMDWSSLSLQEDSSNQEIIARGPSIFLHAFSISRSTGIYVNSTTFKQGLIWFSAN
jgi:hypothetical protein